MVDLDNWLVGNPLVIPKFKVQQKPISFNQAHGIPADSVESIRA